MLQEPLVYIMDLGGVKYQNDLLPTDINNIHLQFTYSTVVYASFYRPSYKRSFI